MNDPVIFIILLVAFLIALVPALYFRALAVTTRQLLYSFLLITMVTVLAAVIISLGGECTFKQTLLLQKTCSNTVLFPPKTMFPLVFTSVLLLIMLLLSCIRDTLRGSHSDAK
jgi:hypothetical protein